MTTEREEQPDNMAAETYLNIVIGNRPHYPHSMYLRVAQL